MAALAVVMRTLQPAPPSPTAEGLATVLGQQTNRVVGPRDFVWEPSGGLVVDAVLGRRVLFLARPAADAPRDLFRGLVRVSPDGKPMSISRVLNLTSSPLGDSQGLVLRGEHAAFATSAYGLVQKITVLNLAGDTSGASSVSLADRLMGHLTNLQETGSLSGLGKMEIMGELPAPSAILSLSDNALAVEGGASKFTLRLETGEVLAIEPRTQAPRVTALQVPQLAKPPVIWAVDTVRAVVGPAPIAWLEEQAFGMKDRIHRLAYRSLSGEQSPEMMATIESTPVPSVALSRPVLESADIRWPPANLTSIWQKKQPNEGVWLPVEYPFLKPLEVAGAQDKAPRYFYQTFVRPDPKRPYAKVMLVAMDGRQLELHMEGGVEDPRSLTGVRGEGRIPRDPAIYKRVVGAFNGAFKTTHGEYGMMVNRRVLLPPKPKAASVVITRDGKAGFGTWPETDAIPNEVTSYRQNLEPLVEDFRVNPSKRVQWGFQLPGTSMLTQRSALCLTSDRHMLYAWGGEVSADVLASAMSSAGCVYAMHLDMNLHHTAFAFLSIRDPSRRDFDAKILTPEMEVMPERFILWSPKDFFYLTLRQYGPPVVDGVSFVADEGAQPSPAWAPGLYSATVRVSDGTAVRVMVVEMDRVRFEVRQGVKASDEAASGVSAAGSSAEDGDALAAIGLGIRPAAHSSSTVQGRASHHAASRGTAILVIGRDGRLRIEEAGSSSRASDGGDIVQAPLILSGTANPEAGASRLIRQRASACVTSDRYLWIGRGTSVGDDGVVEALKKMGCTTIVSLDGAGETIPFVNRAGSVNPPRRHYDQAAIIVQARPLSSSAFRWQSASAMVAGRVN